MKPAPIISRLIPERPLTAWQGQLVALLMVCLAEGVRWAVEPLVGPQVSFTTLFPAVLVATMMVGWGGAVTTMIVGSVAAVLVSAANGGLSPAAAEDIAPRLTIWLTAGGLVASISLMLRGALLDLRRRERELVDARDQLELLARELEHRGRNALAIVQALSMTTARSVQSVEDYRDALAERLDGLSKTYSLLLKPRSESVSVGSLVREILATFGDQVHVDGVGCEVLVGREACLALTLAFHELGTNAVKYGALSVAEGRVEVRCSVTAEGTLGIVWEEVGGPAVAAPVRTGFGSTLISRVLEALPGGQWRMSAQPTGLTCQIQVAGAALRADAQPLALSA